MNILNSYMRSRLDLSHVGFGRGSKESGYFCTPVQSKVIGWAGVDGIHFCTTRGFDEMIFAVSPANLPGEYVHPVARSFEDFLRLLLACRDTAAIEQCWFMDREVFDAFLQEIHPTSEGGACLDALQKKYKLTPMEDPYAYIHSLQREFDYSRLRFPPEYYELVEEPAERPAPQWKVTWDGDFFDEDSDSVGGDTVSLGAAFSWAGIDWMVPEIYTFDHGVIVYLLGRVDPELVPQGEYDEFLSPEALEQMMAENPLNFQFRPEASVNGLAFRSGGSRGITWMPVENWNQESRWVLEHYDLDLKSAWQIHKIRFFWPVCGRVPIDEMRLTLRQNPVPVSGTHFKTPLDGGQVRLKHPQTGKEYTLYVVELKQERADYGRFHDQSMEYPDCYTRISFRMEPDMTPNQFRIMDCARSDQPRYAKGTEQTEYHTVFSVGIIGGADGPTAILPGKSGQSENRIHRTTSALHFDPVKEIEWRIVFQETPHGERSVSLTEQPK